MNYIDLLAFVFFLATIVVLFAKLYNLTKLGKAYELFYVFAGLFVTFLSRMVMLGILASDYTAANAFFFSLTDTAALLAFFVTVLEIILQVWQPGERK
jgi:hypothetical protein